jgi:hypothetical protein
MPFEQLVQSLQGRKQFDFEPAQYFDSGDSSAGSRRRKPDVGVAFRPPA